MTTALFIAVLILCALVAGLLFVSWAVIRRLDDHEARLSQIGIGSATWSTLRAGDPVPSFAVADTTGTTIRSTDLAANTSTLLAFVSATCPACRDHLPGFVAAATAVPTTPSLTVLSGDLAEAQDLLATIGDAGAVICDDTLADRFGIQLFPTFMRLDHGRVAVVSGRSSDVVSPATALA